MTCRSLASRRVPIPAGRWPSLAGAVLAAVLICGTSSVHAAPGDRQESPAADSKTTLIAEFARTVELFFSPRQTDADRALSVLIGRLSRFEGELDKELVEVFGKCLIYRAQLAINRGNEPAATSDLAHLAQLSSQVLVDRTVFSSRLVGLAASAVASLDATLTFDATLSASVVLVNGRRVDPRRPGVPISAGVHQVHLSQPGFQPSRHVVAVSAGATRALEVTLIPIRRSTSIPTPAAAEGLVAGGNAAVTRVVVHATVGGEVLAQSSSSSRSFVLNGRPADLTAVYSPAPGGRLKGAEAGAAVRMWRSIVVGSTVAWHGGAAIATLRATVPGPVNPNLRQTVSASTQQLRTATTDVVVGAGLRASRRHVVASVLVGPAWRQVSRTAVESTQFAASGGVMFISGVALGEQVQTHLNVAVEADLALFHGPLGVGIGLRYRAGIRTTAEPVDISAMPHSLRIGGGLRLRF
jgi:hypothetical protein